MWETKVYPKRGQLLDWGKKKRKKVIIIIQKIKQNKTRNKNNSKS